jgi:hypothetical protein
MYCGRARALQERWLHACMANSQPYSYTIVTLDTLMLSYQPESIDAINHYFQSLFITKKKIVSCLLVNLDQFQLSLLPLLLHFYASPPLKQLPAKHYNHRNPYYNGRQPPCRRLVLVWQAEVGCGLDEARLRRTMRCRRWGCEDGGCSWIGVFG